ISKSDGKSTAVPGTDVTYTITVTNNGPGTVNGATVSDVLPDGTSYVSGGSYDSGSNSVSFTTGTLAKGDHQDFTLTLHINPSATGKLINDATVAPPTTVSDTNNTNDTADDTDDLTPVYDVSVTKDDGATTVVPGGTTTYTIVVTN